MIRSAFWCRRCAAPVSSGHRFLRVSHVLFVLAVVGMSLPAALAAPTVQSVTLVTGRPDFFMPGAGVANLTAGDLVSGSTRWDNDGDGIVYNDTRVGFLWSPGAPTQVFAEDANLYWRANFQFISAIADNGVTVGTDLLRETFVSLPIVWTPAAGLRFLPLPCPGQPGPDARCSWTGGTAGVSADGAVAVGTIRNGIGASVPAQAASWFIAQQGKKSVRLRLQMLETPDLWSNAYSVSADGAVIVGDSGPTDVAPAAVKWVNGVRTVLPAVGDASSAAFVSRDGGTVIGWASAGGRRVLVRWDATGSPLVATPPGATTVQVIRAINRDGTAAVGALSENGNEAPFVWTLQDGFVVIPELGREADYDMSEAAAVSDDGNSVVGSLNASVVSNGDPPPIGFLWTRADGFVKIDDLLTASGFPAAGYYSASAISADGLHILVTGDPVRTLRDTNSSLIVLQAP